MANQHLPEGTTTDSVGAGFEPQVFGQPGLSTETQLPQLSRFNKKLIITINCD